MLNALQRPFTDQRPLHLCQTRQESDQHRSKLSQCLRIDEVVQGADMDPPFLEVMETVDDAPLIPAQAIQLRHDQFVTLHQGIQSRLGLRSVFLRRPGADGLLEDAVVKWPQSTPCSGLSLNIFASRWLTKLFVSSIINLIT